MKLYDVHETRFGIQASVFGTPENYNNEEILEMMSQCGDLLKITSNAQCPVVYVFGNCTFCIRSDALDTFNGYLKNDYILSKIIEKYKNKEAKVKLHGTNKRVNRINKYAKRRIVAGVGILTILGSATMGLLKQPKSSYSTVPTVEESSIEFETTMPDLITENDNLESETTYATLYEQPEELCASLEYEDRSSQEKIFDCKEQYFDTIQKYAIMYGIDPKLMLAIATQERGIHSYTVDKDGGLGLMQIQLSVWDGEELSAYNYETGEVDSFILNEQSIANLDNNIRYGCMVFQNCLRYMNNNILAAIQCYNYGSGNMESVFASYELSTGINMHSALLDQYNTEWINHRNTCNEGDCEYLEHVLSWLGEDSYFEVQTQDGLVQLHVNNNVRVKEKK